MHVDRQAFVIQSTPNVPSFEFEALHALYEATNGQNWQWRNASFGEEWSFDVSNPNPCTEEWQGLECILPAPYDYYHIVELHLDRYNLVGSLPVQIGNLSAMQVISLESNQITGCIPRTLEALNNLTYISLQDNYMNGTLPSFLGGLQHLLHLVLGFNAFSGSIPNSLCELRGIIEIILGNNALVGSIPNLLGNLQYMKSFDAYNNSLTGTLPDSIGSLASIRSFNVYNNSLNGMVPDSISNLLTLESMTLGNNRFSGLLPSGIGALSRVTYLDLVANYFTGKIPPQWANLKGLEVLYLNDNLLHGHIDVVCELRNITQLILEVNRFNGTIPACIGDLPHLVALYASKNQFTGSIPDSLHQLQGLLYLELNQNKLTGTIPPTLAQLTRINVLSLFDNWLVGSIPVAFQTLSNLVLFLLQDNMLTGPIENIFNATLQHSLESVQLSGNEFSGPIPSEPFKIQTLSQFSVVDNCLSGELPATICESHALQILALDGVGSAKACSTAMLPGIFTSYLNVQPLTGGIPSCVFQLPNLTTLHLSGNGLDGSLPHDMRLGDKLVDLALSHNALTGPIPKAIQERTWYSLDLSYNRFSGTLLTSFNTKPVLLSLNTSVRSKELSATYLTGETKLSLDNNRLSGNIPNPVSPLKDISILNGNLFTCNWRQSNLPANDNAKNSYQCGSNSLNNPYYVWLIITCCLALIAAVFHKWDAFCEAHFPRVTQLVRQLQTWMDAINTPELVGKLSSFRFVSTVADIIGLAALFSTALIVLIIAPVYVILSSYYGTMTYEYAWSVSVLFQTGYVAFSVTFVMYVLLMVGVLLMLRHWIGQYLSQAITIDVTVSWRERLARVTITKASAQRYLAFATFVVVNFGIVIGANVAFLYTNFYGNNAQLLVAQILLSFFKGFWNAVGSNYVLRRAFLVIAVNTEEPDFISTLLFASLMNNIAIPCLAIAMISPNCFYNIFVAAPAVEYQYTYQECAIIALGHCVVYYPHIATTSYQPPFTYSYQCGAQYVTSYAATFVYLAMEVAFVLPLDLALRSVMYERTSPGTKWYDFMQSITPALLKVHRESSNKDIVRTNKVSRHTFDVNKYLVQLLTYLGVILTFGVVFPPLAAAMLVAIGSLILTNKLATGRYLRAAVALEAPHRLDALEKDCQDLSVVHMIKLRRATTMLVWFSCFFFAIFFFDTLGNEVGFTGAFWVLLVWPLIPCGMYVLRVVRLSVHNWYAQHTMHEAKAKKRVPTIEMKDRSTGVASVSIDMESVSGDKEQSAGINGELMCSHSVLHAPQQ